MIFEKHVSLSQKNRFVHQVSDILLEREAKLHHLKLIAPGLPADRPEHPTHQTHWIKTAVRQSRNSRYRADLFALSATFFRDHLEVTLMEEGARCALFGTYYAKYQQQNSHHPVVKHQASIPTVNPFIRASQMTKDVLFFMV